MRGVHHVRAGLLLASAFALAMLAFRAAARVPGAGSADEAVMLWMATRSTPLLDAVALRVTGSGEEPLVLAMLAATVVALLLRRRLALAALVVVAVGAASEVNSALKAIVARPRPRLVEWRIDHAAESSFPSGHAMVAMTIFVVSAYLAHRLIRPRWLRLLSVGAVGVLVFLVGLSRVYLGVHYPSDVMAGYLVGLGWATACAAGAGWLSRRAGGPPS